ncbi:T9SS type A sorting domain-containing protein [Flavobacterium terrisoli]|uniref:T9SS type A sorting domain-containing protein n=1 Tax=Flavobacterium terrisoli TaxID=3242195 RepID=UPI002543A22B|nr:T9SS type A sorting domain-containing protein [Flavobacterium buctense]
MEKKLLVQSSSQLCKLKSPGFFKAWLLMLVLITFSSKKSFSQTIEQFNYAAGTAALNAKNGGSGWCTSGSTNWFNTNTGLDIFNGTMAYSKNSLALSTLGTTFPSTGTGGQNNFRKITSYLGQGCGNNTYYISFLVRQKGGSNMNGYAGVSLFSSNLAACDAGTQAGTEQLIIGKRNGSGNVNWGFQIGNNINNGNNTGVAIDGTTRLIVVKISAGSGSTWSIRMWVDPALNNTLTDGQIGTAAGYCEYLNAGLSGSTCFDKFRIEGGGGSGIDLDEFRFSSTYTDVIPVQAPGISIGITSGANPVCSGTSVTFTATPTNGGTTPTYIWKKNGNAISGATGVTYTGVAGTDFVNTDQITCQVTQDVGTSGLTAQSTTSSAITMTVNTAVAITTNVTNGSACQGNSAVFSVAATGTGLGYKWQVNTGSGFVDCTAADGSGFTTNTFTTVATTGAMNGYVYQCLITGTAPCSGLTSASGTLTVVSNPTISVPPTTNACTAQGTASIVSSPAGVSSFAWYRVGSPDILLTNTTISGVTYSGATTATLSMSGLTVADNGAQFYVIGTGCGGNTATSGLSTLTINTTPSQTITAPASTCANSTGNLASVPNAGVGATYAWTIGGGTITSAANIQQITFTAGASGSVTLNCVVTANGCPSAGGQNTSVTINAIPSQTITAPGFVCGSSTGNLASVPVSAGGSYAWSITGGTITSATNIQQITFTANASGSVVLNCVVTSAQNCSSAGGQNTSIPITPATAVTGNPSKTPQSICLGGSATALSVTAVGSALTYQWYSNLNDSNSGGTLISGAVSASYTPTFSGGATLYYYCVVGGGCAPTSVPSDTSGPITFGGLPSDTANYTITNGGNQGLGFGPWAYSVSGSGGTFNGSSDIGTAWGIYANNGGSVTASRPFLVPLSSGNTVSFAFDNGGVDNVGSKVGVRLKNASNNVLTEFRFLQGVAQYSIADSATNDTGVNYTSTGLSNVTFAYTGSNTYSISITRSGVTTVLTGRTFASVAGGSVPSQIEFFNNNAGDGSTRDVFFNNLNVNYPKIFVQPSTDTQTVCQNAATTALSVTAYGANLGYQWYSNPGNILLGGATSSSFTPPSATAGTNTYYCVVSYTGCGTAPTPATSSSSGNITVNPSVGTPSFTTGSTSLCQDAPDETYTAIASNSTGITYSVSPVGAGTINPTSGLMNWNANFTGQATITASAAGCNGPTTFNRIVDVLPSVGTPSFTAGATAICQNAANGTYTATATNATGGIFYAVEPEEAGVINDVTGVMDWDPAFTGEATITAFAFGCNGPTTADRVVTVSTNLAWYRDFDNDGYGDLNNSTSSCTQPVGYVANSTDCNDSNNAIHPNAFEVCFNGIDDDCDGFLSEGCAPALTSILPSFCGNTLSKAKATITASAATYSGPFSVTYLFRITNLSTNTTVDLPRAFRNFNLGMTNIIAYGTQYSVIVAAVINGEQQPFSAPCLISTPGVPTTKLVQCGTTATSMSSSIACNSVSYALAYQFEVSLASNPGVVKEFERLYNNFSMIMAGTAPNALPLLYDTDYVVRVRAKVLIDGEEVWGAYGDPCTVTTPLAPDAFMAACDEDGITPATMSTILYANTINYTSMYRFTLVSEELGYNQFVEHTFNNFRLSDFEALSPLTPGATYSIFVDVQLFGNYYPGKDCQLIVPFPAKTRMVETEFEVKAYPNPFANNFLIDVTSESDSPVSIKVYDMVGRLVDQQQFGVNNLESSPIGDQYPSGVYNVVITQDETVKTLRVVKR